MSVEFINHFSATFSVLKPLQKFTFFTLLESLILAPVPFSSRPTPSVRFMQRSFPNYIAKRTYDPTQHDSPHRSLSRARCLGLSAGLHGQLPPRRLAQPPGLSLSPHPEPLRRGRRIRRLPALL